MGIAPLVSSEIDLRDFAFMPLDVTRLRDSDLTAITSGDGFRAAVLLWCAAWHQIPASSLPMDDRMLAKLAGYGRDLAGWQSIKAEALHGFVECDDGRLYHPTIAEKANEAWEAKLRRRARVQAAIEAKAKRNIQRDEERDEERDEACSEVQGTGTGTGTGIDKKEGDANASLVVADAPTPAPIDLKFERDRKRQADEREALRAVGEAWNTLAAELGLASIEEIPAGSAREKAALARIREARNFDVVFAKIRGSPFLRGDTGKWKADFNWVINPTNILKILEGNYDEIRQAPSRAPDQRSSRSC